MTGAHSQIQWPLAISRGAFLACSWTWCIGMWLPIILLREFGWMGFVAFAIPNVVGAAAMGLVLRRPGAAEALATRYARAIRWFAVVTIAFHAFFITWKIGVPFIAQARPIVVVPALVLFASAFGLRRVGSAGWGVFALIAWFVSIAFVAAADLTGPTIGLLPADFAGESPPTGLLWLTPVMALGFAACPFLDPTFLRVRRETPGRTGDAAFVLGFGVLFFVMIALTALYAYGYLHEPGRTSWSFYLLGHFLLQSIFTTGAMAREIDRRALLTPILVGVALALVPFSGLTAALRLGFEDLYLVFMSFYGLVFPAYAWIVMLPRRRRAGLATWAFAVIAGAPMFWLGFVEERWVWLAPGLAIVLLTPLVRGLLSAGGAAPETAAKTGL